MKTQDIRTQNDLLACLAEALNERDAGYCDELMDIVDQWLIDNDTKIVLTCLIEAAMCSIDFE